MNKLQKEAYDAINKLNEELSGKYTECIPMFSITLRNDDFIVLLDISHDKFHIPEFIMYISSDDDRKYYYLKDEYESFERLLKRKFKEIKKEINKINI